MALIIASSSSALGPSGNPLFDDSHIWISFNVVVCRWKLAWNLQVSSKTLHSCATANSSGVLRTCAKCWGEELWLPVDSTLAPLQQTLWLTMVPVDLKFPEHLWIFVLDFICLSFLRQNPWQQQSSPYQIKQNNNNKTQQQQQNLSAGTQGNNASCGWGPSCLCPS